MRSEREGLEDEEDEKEVEAGKGEDPEHSRRGYFVDDSTLSHLPIESEQQEQQEQQPNKNRNNNRNRNSNNYNRNLGRDKSR